MTVQIAVPNVFRTIAPNDTTDLPFYVQMGPTNGLTDSIFVGTGGIVVVRLADGVTKQTFTVPSGAVLRVAARGVDASVTSALLMVAQYIV